MELNATLWNHSKGINMTSTSLVQASSEVWSSIWFSVVKILLYIRSQLVFWSCFFKKKKQGLFKLAFLFNATDLLFPSY